MSRRTRRLLVLVAAVLSIGMLAAACDPAPAPPPPPLGPAATDVLKRHQDFRAFFALPQLQIDGDMTDHAQFAADRLAAGATDCSPLRHSPELGTWYGGTSYGENVACVSGCPADGAQVWNLWLNSPPHLANIARPVYERIGIGVACSGVVAMYVVQFRSP